MSKRDNARIPCSTETRRLVKAQKRGGESYDELLLKMVKQYDQEKAAVSPSKGDMPVDAGE